MKIYDVAFIGMGASALATAKLNYAGTNHSLIAVSYTHLTLPTSDLV